MYMAPANMASSAKALPCVVRWACSGAGANVTDRQKAVTNQCRRCRPQCFLPRVSFSTQAANPHSQGGSQPAQQGQPDSRGAGRRMGGREGGEGEGETRGPAQRIPKAEQKLGVGEECAKLACAACASRASASPADSGPYSL